MKRNLTTANRLSRSKAWLTARPLLGKLIKWTVLAVLTLTLTTVILYGIGSYREASDDAQLALVRLCLILSLLLVISSFYGLILDVYYAIRKRRAAYLAGALGYLVIMVLGFACVLGTAFIIGAVGGTR